MSFPSTDDVPLCCVEAPLVGQAVPPSNPSTNLLLVHAREAAGIFRFKSARHWRHGCCHTHRRTDAGGEEGEYENSRSSNLDPKNKALTTVNTQPGGNDTSKKYRHVAFTEEKQGKPKQTSPFGRKGRAGRLYQDAFYFPNSVTPECLKFRGPPPGFSKQKPRRDDTRGPSLSGCRMKS